jgi:glycosyltransferase
VKISIISIVYNNEDHILDCINSVNNQKYDNMEYIIIDGGSTDGTVKKIEENNDRIDVFISEKDKGLYDALNKGIKKATGDVIGILHSDDVFFNQNVLLKVASAFKESKADLVYGKGVYVSKTNLSKMKRIYSSNNFNKAYLYFGWIPLHTTIFVKKHIFEKYGLYDLSYSIASDYEISLRWFLNDEIKKYYLDCFFVKMRLGGKSTTTKLQKKKSSEDLEIIKSYNLWGVITLFFKIARKIPQYIKPIFFKY